MADRINITVQLFGAFRRYERPGAPYVLNVMKGASLMEVRERFIEVLSQERKDFSDHVLVSDSAFATESRILKEDTNFESDCMIAVLPPVCGG